jgi:hypothetical protein
VLAELSTEHSSYPLHDLYAKKADMPHSGVIHCSILPIEHRRDEAGNPLPLTAEELAQLLADWLLVSRRLEVFLLGRSTLAPERRRQVLRPPWRTQAAAAAAAALDAAAEATARAEAAAVAADAAAAVAAAAKAKAKAKALAR